MPKLLTEKFVQDRIIDFLSRKGWSRNLRSKTEKEHGVDIKVRNNKFSRYWLIEVKGDASMEAKYPRSHREVNFNLALGQIITRMKRNGTRGYKYGYMLNMALVFRIHSKIWFLVGYRMMFATS